MTRKPTLNQLWAQYDRALNAIEVTPEMRRAAYNAALFRGGEGVDELLGNDPEYSYFMEFLVRVYREMELARQGVDAPPYKLSHQSN